MVATIVTYVLWPTKETYGYLIGALWIAFLIIYPFVYVRKTRIVIQDGWLRVYDLAWREQSIATSAVAGIRRDKDNYWEVYSLSGEKVRIRPAWRRAKMNELAQALNVPVKGPLDDWRFHTDLSLDARVAFARWLDTRRKLAKTLENPRMSNPRDSEIAGILRLRNREGKLWQAFLEAKGRGGS